MTGTNLHHLWRDDAGVGAIEFGLVATLIAVALIGSFMSLGNEVETHYETVQTEYSEAANEARR